MNWEEGTLWEMLTLAHMWHILCTCLGNNQGELKAWPGPRRRKINFTGLLLLFEISQLWTANLAMCACGFKFNFVCHKWHLLGGSKKLCAALHAWAVCRCKLQLFKTLLSIFQSYNNISQQNLAKIYFYISAQTNIEKVSNVIGCGGCYFVWLLRRLARVRFWLRKQLLLIWGLTGQPELGLENGLDVTYKIQKEMSIGFWNSKRRNWTYQSSMLIVTGSNFHGLIQSHGSSGFSKRVFGLLLLDGTVTIMMGPGPIGWSSGSAFNKPILILSCLKRILIWAVQRHSWCTGTRDVRWKREGWWLLPYNLRLVVDMMRPGLEDRKLTSQSWGWTSQDTHLQHATFWALCLKPAMNLRLVFFILLWTMLLNLWESAYIKGLWTLTVENFSEYVWLVSKGMLHI